MSVAEEFRNLLLHASDLLSEVEPAALAALSERIRQEDRTANRSTPENRYAWNDAMANYRSFTAAMTYALVVIDMTAKFLTDGEPEEAVDVD